jgi:hypothetical protein
MTIVPSIRALVKSFDKPPSSSPPVPKAEVSPHTLIVTRVLLTSSLSSANLPRTLWLVLPLDLTYPQFHVHQLLLPMSPLIHT